MSRPRSSIPKFPLSRHTMAGLARPAAMNGRQVGGGQSAFRAPAVANSDGLPRANDPLYSRLAQHSQPPAPSSFQFSSQLLQHDLLDVEGEQETPVNDGNDQFAASMYPDVNFTSLLDEDNNEEIVLHELGINTEASQEVPSYDTNIGEPASARQKQKRTKNFSEAEDSLLVSAWINISQDPIHGTNQNKNTYWGRIYDYFHSHKTFQSDRNQNSLNKRWGVIQETVSRFAGCLTKIENRRLSDKTIEDKLVDAQRLFKEEDDRKNGFAFMHCWNELKHQQKWLARERELSTPKGSNKRQKAPAESTTEMSNATYSLPTKGQEDDMSTPEYTIDKRPPGTKRVKRELQQARDNRFAATVNTIWEKKKVVDEERFSLVCQLEKDRFDKEMEMREREVAAREKKAAARDKEAEAKCKETQRLLMLEEERIMNLDLSTMPVQVHEYYTRLQEEIMSRRSGM